MELARQLTIEAINSVSDLDDWHRSGFDSGDQWHQGRSIYAAIYPEDGSIFQFELPEKTVESGMFGYIKHYGQYNYVLVDGRVIREQDGQKRFLEDDEINDLRTFLMSRR
jgi:hypothetical protein